MATETGRPNTSPDSNPSGTTYSCGITGGLQASEEHCFLLLRLEKMILSQQGHLKYRIEINVLCAGPDTYNRCPQNVDASWGDEEKDDVSRVAALLSFQHSQPVSEGECHLLPVVSRTQQDTK